MPENLEVSLISEQLKHTIDLLRGEIRELRLQQEYALKISEQRLRALETIGADHEARLREVATGVTQFKVWSGLANGGSSLMAAAAFLKSWLMG